MWSSLPKNLTHVDAVYERPDRKIAIFIGKVLINTYFIKVYIHFTTATSSVMTLVWFSGKELYLFDSQYLLPGYPKPLRTFGLPESLEKLDAAMVWGHNGNTYFYSGTMYWK